jgi:lipopolysaccharide/colanic/teichoic acid biosynthesis glycosyltransferase
MDTNLYIANHPLSGLQARAGLPRVVEIVLAAIALVASFPILILAALAIAVDSEGSPLFRQERIGRSGCVFLLFKLRTMHLAGAGLGVTSADDDRVTPIGRLLRRTKLDELPQLWNVVKGDMSLVGPRPEVPRYVDLANPEWRLVLSARPGITDPMTLRLRCEEELIAAVKEDRERFYLDAVQPFKLNGYLDYLIKRTWWRDLLVLSSTVIMLLTPWQWDPAPMEEILAFSSRWGRSHLP